MTVSVVGKPTGCKLIRISADIDNGIIRSISIRGDFFAIPEESFERIESLLADSPLSGIGVRFDSLLGSEGVQAIGISGTAVEELLMEGVSRA